MLFAVYSALSPLCAFLLGFPPCSLLLLLAPCFGLSSALSLLLAAPLLRTVFQLPDDVVRGQFNITHSVTCSDGTAAKHRTRQRRTPLKNAQVFVVLYRQKVIQDNIPKVSS